MNNSTRGLHFILTGFVSADCVETLNNPEGLKRLLLDAVALVGMQPLMEPVMLPVPLDETLAETEGDCGGVTGFVILSTSHVSIHTWPLHRRLSFDLYSCHNFSWEPVLEFLKDRVGLTGGRVVLVDRTPDVTLQNQIEVGYASA